MIPKKQRQAAITHLLNTLQHDDLQRIYQLMQQSDWPDQYHLSIGILVRNLLRQEFEWDDQTLDTEWVNLVIEAVRQYMRVKPNGPVA